MRLVFWALMGALVCSNANADEQLADGYPKELPVKEYRPEITPRVADVVKKYAGTRNFLFERIFGKCGDPCIVEGTLPGGDYQDYEWAAAALLAGARTGVQIQYRCISACTVFMDLARERICIGPDTVLYFHRGFRHDRNTGALEAVLVPRHSKDIERWIKSRNGLPKNGNFIRMQYKDAKKIWRTCKGEAQGFETPLNAPLTGFSHSLY